MSGFNQLRQNVRNYCVGLTCEEIEKEIALNRDSPNRVERAKYFAEYLEELEKEQNSCKLGDCAVGELFSEKHNCSHVYIKMETGNVHPVIFPSCDRGMVGTFYNNSRIYVRNDITITMDKD